ncbi:MAG: hypothetical protein V4712_17245 [Pseudomonadota bacterium]
MTAAPIGTSAPVIDAGGSYIDWSAILAGAAIAAAIGTLATAFGAALGLSAVSAEPGEGSVNVAMVIGALWLVITLVASYGAGGYVTGRMRRRIDTARIDTATGDEVSVRDGMNGLAVWAVGMLVTAILLTNAASNVVSAAGSVASTAVTAAGTAAGGALAAAGAALPEDAGDAALSFATDTLLRTTPVATAGAPAQPSEEAARQTSAILGNVMSTGEISDADRAYLEASVAAQTGLPAAEVTARVDAALAQAESLRAEAAAALEEAKATAIEVAETARISTILSAFLLTAASLVAAAAATVAAVRGGAHRDEGRAYAGLTYRR